MRCFFERSLSALGALLGFGGPVVEVSRKALLRPGADDVVAPGVRLLGRGEEEVPFLFGEAVGVRQ